MVTLLLVMSPLPPPPPLLPEINSAFSCRMFSREGVAPFRLRGSARTLPQQPPTIWDPVAVRFESDDGAFPSFEQTVQLPVQGRSGVTVLDERDPLRRLAYHFSVSSPPSNGYLLIVESSGSGPRTYIAAGLCDLQPIEAGQ
jgi:hypothetical protein